MQIFDVRILGSVKYEMRSARYEITSTRYEITSARYEITSARYEKPLAAAGGLRPSDAEG